MDNMNAGYGYADDSAKPNISFGGNFGNTFLKKFEYITNAGKDGADGEALDIVFSINGSDKNYRIFPVTRVYAKDNTELTPDSPDYKGAMQEAMKELSQRVVQILKCFRTEEQVIAAFSVPIQSFEQYCAIAKAGLPSNFSETPLDIFMQYQWSITGTNTRTFLEIPKKTKYGKFVCAAVAPVGVWKEERGADGSLFYKDESGNKHPFERGKWFMESKFAHLQQESGSEEAHTNMPPPSTPQSGNANASGW